MSLVVPYLLDAAAPVAPDALITIADTTLTLAELGQLTRAAASRLLCSGYTLGASIVTPPMTASTGIIEALGATRAGGCDHRRNHKERLTSFSWNRTWRKAASGLKRFSADSDGRASAMETSSTRTAVRRNRYPRSSFPSSMFYAP